MSLEGQCGACTHYELDGEVCSRLTQCDILHGACGLAGVVVTEEVLDEGSLQLPIPPLVVGIDNKPATKRVQRVKTGDYL